MSSYFITGNFTQPYLRLPNTLVEDQITFTDDDLSCTAHLGYPLENKKLKIQVKFNNSQNFQDYSPNSFAEATGCLQKTTINLSQQTFQNSYNGSTIRCVILDQDDTLLESSAERTLRLLESM